MVVETLSAQQAEVPGRIRMDSFPSLQDTLGNTNTTSPTSSSNQNPNPPAARLRQPTTTTTKRREADDDADWDFIDDPEDDEALAEERQATTSRSRRVMFNPKVLHRCASTPDFGNYDDEPNPFADDAAATTTDGAAEVPLVRGNCRLGR